MAYDADLADKVRAILATKPGFSEKNMFGGLCFLLAGNMCCGIVGDKLMLRVDPDETAALLKEKHVVPMDFTGRPLKGMIYVLPAGWKRFETLAARIEKSIAFIQTLPPKSKKPKR
ncbi:MAG: TfoX/Sxy family protein [Candidatus Firestonebacteria bacterium]|nr:TfoX/Sxy family protein [Candidatus Firestonebacteria bacterium]